MGELRLDKKELRKFGLMTGLILVALFGLALPWLKHRSLPLWPWIITAILWVFALFMPKKLDGFYRVWMKIGTTFGKVNSRIILGIVYYLVITPMALVMRLFRHDPMARTIDRNANSYRNQGAQRSKTNMEVPF
jgi:hypothetical protein